MAHRTDSGRQLSLFEADQRGLDFEAYASLEPQPVQPSGQLSLFEGRVPLVGEIEAP